ncbi:hypothetical protein PV326_003710 [Microctonus aethiopoides]|nr:hypothetical protein PV326_003710 [Microctonus aethiopoides]
MRNVAQKKLRRDRQCRRLYLSDCNNNHKLNKMTNFNLITFTSRMILFIIVFVAFALDDCHVAGNTTVAIAKEECRKRIAQCSISNGANTPVCGSDGVTYSSQCEVVSKQCRGGEILIKHTGPCLATSPCSAERIARPGVPIVCRPDGNYAPVQCHTETGYCWCVTPQGRPLPNTTVKYRRPKCAKVDVITTLSSSSSSSSSSISNNDDAVAVATGQRRRSPVVKQRRQFTSRHRNTCDRAEKSKFNSNLIENFKIEYRRTNISSDGDKNVDRVLSWKFMTLDKDGDGHLDRTEYKELRRLAKKAVRPKKCARTFARTCDLNQDLKLSRQEWGSCLANDFTRCGGDDCSQTSSNSPKLR